MATAVRKPKGASEQSVSDQAPAGAQTTASSPEEIVSANRAEGLIPGTGPVAAHSAHGDGSANDQSLGDHDEAVRQAAYRHYLDRSARGDTGGSAEQDWLRAEAEIRSAGKPD